MLLSCSLDITCFVVSVQGSVVNTHGQKLTSKAGHTALCCQVKEGVTRIALFSSVTKGIEKINSCKIFTMSISDCEITKIHTLKEGKIRPGARIWIVLKKSSAMSSLAVYENPTSKSLPTNVVASSKSPRPAPPLGKWALRINAN